MYGVPSAAMPLTAGRMTSRMIRAWTVGVTTGAGEYAPMPPVFGPWSPSPRRLWSCDDASASTWAPSAITMKLASSPSRKSSITTRAPASPTALPESIASIAACASATSVATTTPLPAASPSALTTIGAPRPSTQACAAAASVNVRCSAVGMSCRSMKALAKSLELSSCAASRVGPKMRSPAARNASTIPAASGASGPTTVRPTDSRFAKAISVAMSSIGTLTRSGSRAVPALPGATKTFPTRGDCATFQASACSRPPAPTIRTFIARSPSSEHHAAEHEDRAAVIDAAVQRRDPGRRQRGLPVAQRGDRQKPPGTGRRRRCRGARTSTAVYPSPGCTPLRGPQYVAYS